MKEVLQTERFAKWLRKLKDNLAKVAIARRIERLEQGNFGDSKSVGDKVFELRIDVGRDTVCISWNAVQKSSFFWSVEIRRHRVMI